MMAGAHYHITYCQILEAEHLLKLASILKLFTNIPDAGNTSLKDFLKSFSSSVEEHSEARRNLADYTEDLNDLSYIYLDVTTLQSLVFVAGYSVDSYLRHSKCESCLKI